MNAAKRLLLDRILSVAVYEGGVQMLSCSSYDFRLRALWVYDFPLSQLALQPSNRTQQKRFFDIEDINEDVSVREECKLPQLEIYSSDVSFCVWTQISINTFIYSLSNLWWKMRVFDNIFAWNWLVRCE